MKCLYNGKIVLKDKIVENKAILFDKKIIDIIDLDKLNTIENIEKYDVNGNYIAPGLIDLHIHGYMGEDFSDGNYEGIIKISKNIAKNGVTSYLPTVMTLKKEKLKEIFNLFRKVIKEEYIGAEILGVHSEGPFISKKKKGAQKEEYISAPDYEFIEEFKDIISLITIAPEVDGAIDFIDKVKKNTNIVLSMGHTNGTYEQLMNAIDHGITHATHLFNAMTGLHHRNPGAVGAALNSDITCEFIADTIHIHPSLFSFISKVKGNDKVVLITDCMRAGGLQEGTYDLGGQFVTVKDKQCRLEDGTLAGSVLILNEAIKNMKTHTNLPLYEIIKFASLNPAKILNIDSFKGSLEKGKDADIIIFDKDINIKLTIGKGIKLYENK